MKASALISLLTFAFTGMFAWQYAQSNTLRQHNGELRARINQTDQVASRLERENEVTHKRSSESEAALQDLESRLAATAMRTVASPAAGAAVSNAAAATCWSDDVPFVRLSKSHLKTLSVAVIVKDGADDCHLAPGAAALFGLDANELGLVNAAIQKLSQQYLALELASAPQIPKRTRDRDVMDATFEIPQLAAEGARLKLAFTETLAGIIGQVRTDLVMHYGRDTYWRQLAGFGENAKTVTFHPVVDANGQESVSVYADFRGPQNGAYTFKLQNDSDPNAALARALWRRTQAAERQ